MCDDYDGLVLEELVEILHNDLLVVGVQRVGRLVEEEVRRVLVRRAGNQYPLFLPGAKAVAVNTDLRVVAQRQAFNPIAYVRHIRSLPHARHVRSLVAQANILSDGVGEDVALLHHATALPAPCALAVILDLHPSERDCPLHRRVETKHHLQHRGLTAAGGTHNGRDLAVRDLQGDSVQHFRGMGALILESHVIELNVSAFWDVAYLLRTRRLLVITVMDLTEALHGDVRVLILPDEGNELAHWSVKLADDVREGRHHTEGHVAVDD